MAKTRWQLYIWKCRWTFADIVHTVGPQGEFDAELRSCYQTCIKKMNENNLKSIVRFAVGFYLCETKADFTDYITNSSAVLHSCVMCITDGFGLLALLPSPLVDNVWYWWLSGGWDGKLSWLFCVLLCSTTIVKIVCTLIWAATTGELWYIGLGLVFSFFVCFSLASLLVLGSVFVRYLVVVWLSVPVAIDCPGKSRPQDDLSFIELIVKLFIHCLVLENVNIWILQISNIVEKRSMPLCQA